MTQGWFREPKQGYFANNRLSNLIKKRSTWIPPRNVYVGCCLDNSIQFTYTQNDNRNDLVSEVSASFPEMVNHPDAEFRKNTDHLHTAFQLAYKTDVSYFGADGWLSKDPQEAVIFGLA